MNGPSEFTLLGSLRDHGCKDRLPGISVPALITCGEFEGAPRPDTRRHYASLMADAEVGVFPGASHFTFVETPRESFPVVRRFLGENHL